MEKYYMLSVSINPEGKIKHLYGSLENVKFFVENAEYELIYLFEDITSLNDSKDRFDLVNIYVEDYGWFAWEDPNT